MRVHPPSTAAATPSSDASSPWRRRSSRAAAVSASTTPPGASPAQARRPARRSVSCGRTVPRWWWSRRNANVRPSGPRQRIRRPLFAAQVTPAVDLDLARARHDDGGLFGLRLFRVVAPADRAQAIGGPAGLPDAGDVAAAFAGGAISPAIAVGLDIVPLGLFPVALAADFRDRPEGPSERKLLGGNGGRGDGAGAERQGGAKRQSAKRRDGHDHRERCDLPLAASG